MSAEMVTMFVLLIVGAAMWAVIFHRGWSRRDDGWLAGRVRERVRVHTREGSTLEGLLEVADAQGLVLRYATFMGSGVDHELDGAAYVPREQVLFVQHLPSSPPAT